MTVLALLMVVGSGALHATWNLFTKQSGNKIAFLWWAQAVAVAAFLPLALMEAYTLEWSGSAVMWLAASMALHGIYVVLLALAYEAGDLSLVYPLMRGTGPLVVPIVGTMLLGERLMADDWAGVALIVIGIVMLGERPRDQEGLPVTGKAPALAASVGLMVAVYTIADKLAMDHGNIPPIMLNAAGNAGNWLFLAWFALRRKEPPIRKWSANKLKIIIAGIIASGGYTLFLFAITLAPVSQLAPMREVGTVFGTLFGIFLLKEPQGTRRLTASSIITAGIVLLGWQR